jgi:hypothetical protein
MDLRLVAYTPLGDRIGVLPDALTFNFVDPFGPDLATLKIEYTLHGRRFGILEGRPEVAVEWWDGAAWQEPTDARFHVVKRSWNSKDDGAQARQYDAIHLGWLGRKALVWTGDNMNADGKRQFNAANAGMIVGTVFDDAQGRGWGPGIARSFTDAVDSAGQPWAEAVTLAFEPNANLDSVIAAVTNQGLAEVSWTGRTLNLYNPDTTLARDLTVGDAPIWIRHNDGVTAAPEDGSIEDLVTAARLQGDAGGVWDVSNPAADTTYGRLESAVEQSGVTDEGTAQLLIEQTLKQGEAERIQYTREFHTSATRVWPLRDYRPGDWAYVDREDGGTIGRERSRIVQLSLTRDADGVSGHVTFGTRLDDMLTRLARRTAAVTGGTSSGGAGGSPSDPGNRVPADVTGLVASSDAYLDTNGTPRARVGLDWADVSTDAESVLLGIRGYEVWRSIEGGEWTQVTSVVESHVELSPLEVNENHRYRVRAVSMFYTPGGWSAEVPILTASDTTPPPVPSTPILTQRLGVVTVKWNGLSSTGFGMSADFARCLVRLGGATVGEVVTAGDTAIVAGLPYDVAAVFTLVSVDTSGNQSAASASASITPVRLVPNDMDQTILDDIEAAQATADSKNRVTYSGADPVPGTTPNKAGDIWFTTSGSTVTKQWRGDGGTAWTQVTLTNTVIANLDAGKITTGTLSAARIGADTITSTHIAASAITADELATNAVTADKINAGAVTAAKVAADAITADKIAAGAITAAKIDAQTLTGVTIRTATSGKRWVLGSSPTNQMLGYSGLGTETSPGFLTIDADASFAWVQIQPPAMNGYKSANIRVETAVSGGYSRAVITADHTYVQASNLFIQGADVQITSTSGGMVAVYGGPLYSDVGVRARDVRADVSSSFASTSLGSGLNTVTSPGIVSTASAGTNVQINTSNHIMFRASSGLKHKVDVRLLKEHLVAKGPIAASRGAPESARRAVTPRSLFSADPFAPPVEVPREQVRTRVLDIDPIIYKDRHETAMNAKGEGGWEAEPRDWIGWSAESFIRAGWEELVTRDPSTGEPDYLHYERVLPVVVLEINEALADLAARITAIENGVTA